jgi:hypothetical protein
LQAATCLFALGLFLILPVAGHAQAVYGSIVGTVTDPTGAAIPNATITVTDPSKGTSVQSTSNGSGDYSVDHLIVGKYNVKVEAAGFQGFQASGVAVFIDTTQKVNAQLTVGAATQTINVSADAIPELKTDRADVGTTFTAKDVNDLPSYGGTRNFTSLQLLLPGAQILGWSHAADENPQGSQQIQVDGQAFGGVAYELDGTDNQDPILGIIVVNPALDSMSEAKITTQNFDAEFGKAVASVVIASTKSGSNSFHGSAFDYRRSGATLATEPFTQQQAHSGAFNIPPFLYNQFGGSVGGPIIKDKLFFFGDYQGVRNKVASSAQDTVPTNTVLQSCIGNITGPSGIPGCDFSQYANVPGAGQGLIYNNLPGGGGALFPGNTVPTALLSPAAVNFYSALNTAIQTLYPGYQNQPYYKGVLTNNFNASGTGLFNNNQWDARIDGQFSEKMHAFGRFSRFTDVLSGTQVFGPNVGGPGLGQGQPGYGGVSTGANDSFAGGMDFALKPSLLTDFRLGYYRYNIGDNKNDQGVDYMNTLGWLGQNTADPSTSGTGGIEFSTPPSGGTQPLFGSGLATSRCNCPLTEREDQFQAVNNWTKIVGNHSVKFGADIRYARNLRVPSDGDRVGVNQFNNEQTALNGNSGGLGFATLALGEESTYGRYVSTSTNAKEFQKRDFFYVQDTWRTTPNLTLNLGVRYEIYFPEAVNAARNGALMNLTTGYLSVAGVGGIPTDMGWGANFKAFSPRLGAAYQLNPKTVIRAGYGRSYDIGVFGSIFGHVVTQNLPVLANQQINPLTSTAPAFIVDNGPAAYQFPAVPSNGLLPSPSTVSPKARPDPLRLPLLDAWNAAIQRAITPTMSVTIAYVGNKGTHTLADGDGNNTNPNEAGIFLPASYSVVPGLALHYDPTVSSSTTTGPGAVAGIAANGGTQNSTYLQRYYGGTLPSCQNSAYQQPTGPGLVPGSGQCGWNNGINYYADALDTHFNALQVTLAKQFTHGFSFTSNYQWARGFDYNSGYTTWGTKYLAYGRDSSVREQTETTYGVYQLPFGRAGMIGTDVPRWANAVIGGWQLSGVLTWSGGLPFTLNDNECNYSVPGSAPCYANSISGSRLPLHLTAFNPNTSRRSYFTPVKTLASQDPTTLQIHYTPNGGFNIPQIDAVGNVGRNNYFGPNFFNTDASLQKNIPIHEDIQAQFRFDAFNVFNHINPGNPSSTSVDGANGDITGEAPGGNPRFLMFSLRVQF